MNSSLALALTLAQQQLNSVAESSNYWTILNTSFGTHYDVTLATTLQQQWQVGDFSALPPIEILSSSVLGNALGAYAQSTNKIYLSDQFVATASDAEIVAVLLEEIGHYLDAQLNSSDTPGDEGELFSRLVRGQVLTEAQLATIRAEDDRRTIVIDGQTVAVETAITDITVDGDRTITGSGYTAGDTVDINANSSSNDFTIDLVQQISVNGVSVSTTDTPDNGDINWKAGQAISIYGNFSGGGLTTTNGLITLNAQNQTGINWVSAVFISSGTVVKLLAI